MFFTDAEHPRRFYISLPMSTSNVNANTTTPGADRAKHLAAGQHVSLRLWENEQPGEPKPLASRSYETVGYVLKGRAELHLEGNVTPLEPGISYLVPQGPRTPIKSWKPSRP
ncbi:MAG: cupin domain-containing protein [Hymenobacter sp.]